MAAEKSKGRAKAKDKLQEGELPPGVKFPCSQCGICCTTVGLDQKIITDGKPDWATKTGSTGWSEGDVKQFKAMADEYVQLPLKEDGLTCAHLSDDGPPYTCGIYETRPMNCRILGIPEKGIAAPRKPLAMTQQEWLMASVSICNTIIGDTAGWYQFAKDTAKKWEVDVDTSFPSFPKEVKFKDPLPLIPVPEHIAGLVLAARTKLFNLFEQYQKFEEEIANKQKRPKRRAKNKRRKPK